MYRDQIKARPGAMVQTAAGSGTAASRIEESLRRGRYSDAPGLLVKPEGACRHVVKDRMERAGMRWCVAGAQAMLDLRTTYINGQWEEFQNYRIDQAQRRQYPFCDALEAVDWPLAA